jgi:DNA-binding HxlR family transcriptional regulator
VAACNVFQQAVTVEYTLTSLGDSLCEVIEGLRAWAYANAGTMNSAPQAHNQQHRP